jgi:hypothetical protein
MLVIPNVKGWENEFLYNSCSMERTQKISILTVLLE